MNIVKALSASVLALAVSSAFAAGGDQPLETLAPKDARAVPVSAQAAVDVDRSGIDVEDRNRRVDGRDVRLKVVFLAAAKGRLPMFMYFHGGGWVLGDYLTHARLKRDLVVGSGAAAVYLDYTPPLQSQHPTAINQAYAAALWLP